MDLENHQAIEQNIRRIVGDDLEGLTTVVHVPAMVSINHRGETINRQINLIGIDSDTYTSVSDFSKYLLHPENRQQISFLLRETGYGADRVGFPESGWQYRRRKMASQKRYLELQRQLEIETQRNEFLREQMENVGQQASQDASREASQDVGKNAVQAEQAAAALDLSHLADGRLEPAGPDVPTAESTQQTTPAENGLAFPSSPFGNADQPAVDVASPTSTGDSTTRPKFDAVAMREDQTAKIFDPEKEQHDGIVLGISIGSTRYRNQFDEITDYYYVQPGDDIQVTFPSSGTTPRAINERFTVVDFYESKMSEYDATFAFVPLERLQHFRGMQDAVSSIQLRLREGADLDAVRDSLRAQFPLEMMIQVNTWRDLQGALLAAVQMETTILNILLFLIIAVAGFGILATFFMIVVEKTKDIGVLKSLGAAGQG